jgi:hypothetical protein
MIHTAQPVRTLQVIATIVGAALLLWSTGFPLAIRSAEAGSITNASDTLSDSDLGVGSNHTIQFTTGNGAVSGETIVLTFPTDVNEFVIPNLDADDIDVTVNGNEITLADNPSGTTWGVATTTSTITFTTSTTSGATIASSSVVVIEIGTNATFGATGDTQIINPSDPDSYEITLSGTIQDSGAFRVVILDDVVVTASVATNFTFTVGGVDSGLGVNGTTTTGTTTATSVPFLQLSNGVVKTLAQDITVTTNASEGFAVTVFQGPTGFSSTVGADIDGFIDGAYTDTPSAWVSPSANPTNENTWGHWGLTSEDGDLFGSNLWVSPSTTPRTVFSHNDVVNASTTRVGYQVEISALQEAGNDYQAVLTYVATPVF